MGLNKLTNNNFLDHAAAFVILVERDAFLFFPCVPVFPDAVVYGVILECRPVAERIRNFRKVSVAVICVCGAVAERVRDCGNPAVRRIGKCRALSHGIRNGRHLSECVMRV